MFGLSQRELRFALVIGSSHFSQHVYYRILPPLIPILAVVLEYPLWQLGLLISLYSLGMGLAQAPLGILADRYDRRYLLPAGIVLSGLGYLIFAMAPTLGAPLPDLSLRGSVFEGSFLVMAAMMVVIGVGLAVHHPVSYPLISDNVHSDNKGKVLGVFGASSKFGDGATPAVIGVLILAFAWDHIILFFGIAGVIYGVLLYLILREDAYETVPSGQREEFEAEAGSTTERDQRSFLYPMTIIYVFFVSKIITTRGVDTFLPAFLVAMYAYSFSLLGYTFGAESVANFYFAILLFAGAFTQLFLGGLTDVYDARLLIVGCMGIATLGMLTLAIFSLHPLVLVVVIFVLGTGLFGVNPARDSLISDISPPEYEGRAFGYIWTLVTLTTAPMPALIGYLLDTAGMRMGYLILASGTLLGAAVIVTLYSERVYLPQPQPTGRTEGD